MSSIRVTQRIVILQLIRTNPGRFDLWSNLKPTRVIYIRCLLTDLRAIPIVLGISATVAAVAVQKSAKFQSYEDASDVFVPFAFISLHLVWLVGLRSEASCLVRGPRVVGVLT